MKMLRNNLLSLGLVALGLISSTAYLKSTTQPEVYSVSKANDIRKIRSDLGFKKTDYFTVDPEKANNKNVVSFNKNNKFEKGELVAMPLRPGEYVLAKIMWSDPKGKEFGVLTNEFEVDAYDALVKLNREKERPQATEQAIALALEKYDQKLDAMSEAGWGEIPALKSFKPDEIGKLKITDLEVIKTIVVKPEH